MQEITTINQPKKLSWTDVDILVFELVSEIKKSGFNPTMIGAIPRGGWVIGALVAQLLNVRCTISIDIDKSSGKYQVFLSSEYRVAGENVLILEDTMETGQTIHAAADIILKHGAREVRTAALMIHSDCTLRPNYFLSIVSKIPLFPWDQQICS